LLKLFQAAVFAGAIADSAETDDPETAASGAIERARLLRAVKKSLHQLAPAGVANAADAAST
jgi:hypothetical protein